MAPRKLANWLQGYAEFTENTESLPIFHWWVALGTLAGAAQRKIFLDFGHYQIHSNMYVVLVSRPGRGRKSTALRIGKGLLRGAKDYGVGINFSTQASSVAALVQQLAAITTKNKEHQSLTSFSSEIGTLLGVKSNEATDFLTDLFDCNPDWDKQTVGRGLEKIEKPWFNLIGATTPQWLGDNLSKTAVEGGFASRSIFVYGDASGKRIARPKLTDAQKVLRRALVEDLAHISELKGEFTFDEEGGAFYDSWYEDPTREAMIEDERLAGYFERKHIQVLKIAMMLRLADGSTERSDQLILQRRDIEAAIGILEEIEPGMHRAFVAVGKNIYSNDLERMKEQIQRARKLTYKQLLNSNIHALEKDQIDSLVATLIDMGKIRIVDEPATNGNKGVVRWFVAT